MMDWRAVMAQRYQDAATKMGQRQVALQVAGMRERLRWFVPFFASSVIFLVRGYKVTGSFVVLYPLVPMCFMCGYQLDFAYGGKTRRIKDIAESILREEKQLTYVPEWHFTRPRTFTILSPA